MALNLLPYLSNGVIHQRIVLRIERDGVCKPFHIWPGTEEALSKNAGSLPFLHPRELFFLRDKLLPLMFSRFGLCSLKREHQSSITLSTLYFPNLSGWKGGSLSLHFTEAILLRTESYIKGSSALRSVTALSKFPSQIPKGFGFLFSLELEGQSSSTAWKIMLGPSRALKVSPTQGTHLGYCRGWNVLSPKDTWNFMYLLLLIWR